MPYSVPDLPYDYNALEPHIDEATMRVHHDKHHQAYVDKANAALEGTEWADKPVEEVLQNLDKLGDKATPVRNNGGGHYNHCLFWESMTPDGGGEPDGALADAIDSAFGSFSDFQGEDEGRGRQPVRQRLVVAGPRRVGPRRGVHANQDNPISGRADAAAGRRRVGARLLPEVPEPAPRLHRRLVERRQLAQGRRALLGRLRSALAAALQPASEAVDQRAVAAGRLDVG